MNQVIEKNGIKYMLIEPATWLCDRYAVFKSAIADDRVWAVNLSTNKLVTIKAEPKQSPPKPYLFVIYSSDEVGAYYCVPMAKDWETAEVQLDDWLSDEVVNASFQVLNGDSENLFKTSLGYCKTDLEFKRQIKYAYSINKF